MRLNITAIILGIFIAFLAAKLMMRFPQVKTHTTQWSIQSIDTMKFSRDLAREKGVGKSFANLVDTQVSLIANTGATHVAIGTPYDEEFLPVMKLWVKTARKYKLGVWFRGNFAGWEEWFDYKKIDREQHNKAVEKFIQNNPELFEDGDIFSSCPECENGGPGDPRITGDVEGHRNFLIKEYQTSTKAFKTIHKNVLSGFNSMNFDVASVIMDTETTQKLGGIIVVDHYVLSPIKTVEDLNQLAHKTGGLIVLGEVGAPIPDIHGKMTEDEQALWIESVYNALKKSPSILGVNYWTGFGASTQIWDSEYKPYKAVQTITSFYKLQATNK